MASDITITRFDAIGGVRSAVLSALGEAPDGMGCLPYMLPAKYEWWSATSSSGANATKIAETVTGFYTHPNVILNVPRWYRVRAIDQAGESGLYSAWRSATATSTGPGSVDTGELADGAVTETKIDNLAVSRAKIRAAAIGEAQIEDAAIVRAKIRDAAINEAKIENLSVSRAKIRDAAIGNAQIENAAIDNAKIGNLAVKNAQIDNLTIGTGKINLNVITDYVILGPGGVVDNLSREFMQGSIDVNNDGAVHVRGSGYQYRPASSSSNNGNWRLILRRDGQQIMNVDYFYDDNFGQPILIETVDRPGNGRHTYRFEGQRLSGSGRLDVGSAVLNLLVIKR